MDHPWRILLVVDSLDVGGAERHVVDLALALRERGHEVTVACSASGPFARDLERASLPLQILGRLAVKRRLSVSYARRLRQIIRRGRFDLMHAHCYASSAAAALATLGGSVPLVMTEHSEGLWKGPAARSISRWTYHRAASLTAVSAALRRMLIDRYGVPPERVRTIPNAVPPRPLSPGPPMPWFAEKGKHPLVGVVARLQPEKGVGIFLEAAARIVRERPDARFVVAGDGPLRAALLVRVEQLGLTHHVHFAGFQPDVRALLPALDILAVPSRSEGAPLVTLEAMAAGVPIVAAAAGGIPEQIGHGREGVLVPPGDPESLALGILRLLHDPLLARSLAAAAQRRVHLHFTHDRLVREVEDVYRHTLGVVSRVGGARETPAPDPRDALLPFTPEATNPLSPEATS